MTDTEKAALLREILAALGCEEGLPLDQIKAHIPDVDYVRKLEQQAAKYDELREHHRIYAEEAAQVAHDLQDTLEKLNAMEQRALAAEARFEEHTKAVGAFLSEMYAIMVDPLADGEVKVADSMKALKSAALRDREYSACFPAMLEALELGITTMSAPYGHWVNPKQARKYWDVAQAAIAQAEAAAKGDNG